MFQIIKKYNWIHTIILKGRARPTVCIQEIIEDGIWDELFNEGNSEVVFVVLVAIFFTLYKKNP